MSGRARLGRRPLLLAGAAAGGVIAGHLLDALGLLPGVHESAAVRTAALAPAYTALTVLGAGVLAVLTESLLRHGRPALAALVLVAGQTGLLALPEALAEAGGSGGGGGDDPAKLVVAVGLQVLLAVATIGVALMVDALLLRLPRPLTLLGVPGLPRAQVAFPGVPAGRIVGGVRGRGPPVPVIP